MSTSMRPGDLVGFRSREKQGAVGVVSRPIGGDLVGHVIAFHDGHLVGVSAGREDVVPADESAEGFAQLAYNLITLGSRVIEQRLLVYRT